MDHWNVCFGPLLQCRKDGPVRRARRARRCLFLTAILAFCYLCLGGRFVKSRFLLTFAFAFYLSPTAASIPSGHLTYSGLQMSRVGSGSCCCLWCHLTGRTWKICLSPAFTIVEFSIMKYCVARDFQGGRPTRLSGQRCSGADIVLNNWSRYHCALNGRTVVNLSQAGSKTGQGDPASQRSIPVARAVRQSMRHIPCSWRLLSFLVHGPEHDMGRGWD